jgi:1,4-dihydroxy-2-naphthoyl-CoA hydrolase
VRFVVPFDRSFDAVYGLEYLDAGGGEARGRLAVTPVHLGAGGTVHSGIYAAMAESLASTGTAAEVLTAGLIPSGLSNSTHVLAEARDGVLEATARCRARGELDWLWEVEVADAAGTLCAASSVVIAVRPGRAP